MPGLRKLTLNTAPVTPVSAATAIAAMLPDTGPAKRARKLVTVPVQPEPPVARIPAGVSGKPQPRKLAHTLQGSVVMPTKPEPAPEPVAAKPARAKRLEAAPVAVVAPVAKPRTVDPVDIADRMHGTTGLYTGASQVIRGHGHKLSAVNFNRIAPGSANISARDEAFIATLAQLYGAATHAIRDADTGNLCRAASHGWLVPVNTDVPNRRDITIRLTDTGINAARRYLKASGQPFGNAEAVAAKPLTKPARAKR